MPKRALIVIDVQNEYFDGALPISDPPVETSLANIGRAMDAASAWKSATVASTIERRTASAAPRSRRRAASARRPIARSAASASALRRSWVTARRLG